MLQKREKVWKYRVNIARILRTEHTCTRSTNSFIFEQSPPPLHITGHPHTTGGKYSSTVLAFQSKTTRDMLSISKHREAVLKLFLLKLLTSRMSSCISIIFSSSFCPEMGVPSTELQMDAQLFFGRRAQTDTTQLLINH